MSIIDKVKKALVKPSEETEEQKDRKKIDQLKNYKKRFEPRWYIASAFFDGVHFTFGKKDKDGNWSKAPTPKNKPMREIPKAKKQLLNIRNMLLKLKQKPVTYPDRNVITLDGVKNAELIVLEEKAAIQQGRYVEYFLNEKLKIRKYLPKLVRWAGQYNVAYIQILNEDGKKSCEILDPFDVSIYPRINDISDYPTVVKHISKQWDEVKDNDDYDQKAVKDLEQGVKQGKYSNSVYKNALEVEKYGLAPDDMCLLDEMYQMVDVKVDPTGNEIQDLENFTGEYEEVKRCLIKTYIGDKQIRREMTNLTSIPISMFMWGDEPYGTSFLEDLIPLNRAYDVFISKLEHKAKKLDTGRISMQKGEDSKVITTNDAEIIRWKRYRPEIMAEAGVPNAFMEAINLIEGDIKEQGVAVATGGSLPSGVDAYRAIETLKESDYASIGTQQDNLNFCLQDLTEKVIDMLAYDMTEIETAQVKGKNGKTESIRVVGKRGAEILTNKGKNPLPADVVVIDPNRTTKVEIESEMTHTQEAKKELVLDLVREGLLPAQMAIELMKVGNAQEIMDMLLRESTMGKSMIDMPDFKLLPKELQAAIAKYLSQGGEISNGNPVADAAAGGPAAPAPAAPVAPVAPAPANPAAPAQTNVA